jgi:hypothetical protein
MKLKAILTRVTVALFVVIVCKSGLASSCYHLTPNMGVYINTTSNGATIYTTVTLSGTPSMTATPPCVVPPAGYHYATTGNFLTKGTTRIGNTNIGQHQCTSCYISSTNTQSADDSDGSDWTFEADWMALCSSAGNLYSGQSIQTLSISTAYWGPPPVIFPNGDCSWSKLACSSGTPRCTVVRGLTFVEGCPQYMRSETLVINGNCEPDFALGFSADGPGPCD